MSQSNEGQESEERLVTDSFFQQGITHEVCEDYALSGPDFVILSDGCSNGGGPRIDSDWGSRILCKAAQDNLALISDPLRFLQAVGATACEQAEIFPSLTPDCLAATLLTICPKDDNTITGLLVGDGVIGGKRRGQNKWDIHFIEYPSSDTKQGAPFYLKYYFHDDMDRYIEQFAAIRQVLHMQGDLMSQEDTLLINKQAHDFEAESFWTELDFACEEYEYVFGGTDGIFSFVENITTTTSKHQEAVDSLKVLRVLLDIPAFRPGFLRLQRNWAWKRVMKGTFLKNNWQNIDDTSMGLIYVR